MLKALIVDDEYPARMELRFRLDKHPDVQVIGEAGSAREAMALIQALDYDVVFLDVQMPGLNGIDLARQLRERERGPAIVFVTAYESYAVPAFETRAVDYLLKPFDDDRLSETLQRLRELKGRESAPPVGPEPEAAAEPARRGSPLPWIVTERDDKAIPVPLPDVVFISAEGDSVYVHTHSDRLQARMTLQELAERLPPDQFFRSHRSFIVNIQQVKEITPYFNGAYILKMKDKGHSEVAVSRGNVRRMKELFYMN